MDYHKIRMSLKDAKINFLVDIATDLFMCRSVNEVTIRDIAISAQVGEATIYRYFGNKQNVVIHVAMKIQGIVSEDFFKLEKGKTGFEKLVLFYQSYYEIFSKHPNFYKFLNEFDVYMAGEHSDAINPYEEAIDSYKDFYMQAYELGLKDGSIKEQKDIETFYFSTTHALLELCKKLAAKKVVLTQDKHLQKKGEVQCLIDIIVESLKK